jgi:hypothetical protein|tara:strand:+ start:2934 stop:3230 length:297 start_codon:yes stop_codon:yes gene_type:complete
MKNIIRNFNKTTRTAVYTVGYIIIFVLFVSTVVFAIEILSTYVGEGTASMIAFGILGVYLVVSMALFSARNRVRDETYTEQEVIRRLQEIKSSFNEAK